MQAFILYNIRPKCSHLAEWMTQSSSSVCLKREEWEFSFQITRTKVKSKSLIKVKPKILTSLLPHLYKHNLLCIIEVSTYFSIFMGNGYGH